jgi:hypothetical protein
MGGGHRGGGGGGGGWGGGQESSPYKATTKWASGDQNEPESSDTMTRGTTADQNEIKFSPLQSRVAVLNLSTSIQDVVSEVVLFSHASMVMLVLLFIVSQTTH